MENRKNNSLIDEKTKKEAINHPSEASVVQNGLIPLMTIDEVATYLHVPKGTIYNWVSLKKIPHIKYGKHLLFAKDDINKIIEKKKVPVHW